ncbi:hypothetical protein P171DRAFT_411057 [Karstenula rhodostoma CBS 690.94]|uniref:Uncharacterized protein n=1 Tax=Karstenula rhodostoma CBS 690.94 TaxID=1392251 RepID=A0A9P4PHU4_9PLEO|nr:hypothetical protein P171DRAFT_411057 [Karstenula rhodostoma CBS 690.94]
MATSGSRVYTTLQFLGVLNAFGVFQTYYKSGVLFDRTLLDIAWIGAIQSFMVLLMGVNVGPIYN